MIIIEKLDDKRIVATSNLNYIKSVEDAKIRLPDGKNLIVIKVEPINFNLKSKSEQRVILECYKTLLKQCDFDFQVYIQTQKANIENHISEIEKCVKYEPELLDMAEDYINLITEISNSKSSISRKFYIIFEDKPNDSRENIIIESLKLCGNIAHKCDSKEILDLFNCCFKKQQSLGVASAS